MIGEEELEHWRELSRQADKASRKEKWGQAVKYCNSFLNAVKGHLDPKDPPVLRAKRDYSEALAETGDHEKADKIQHGLLKDLDSPDGPDEEAVLYDVLFMRNARAVDLSNLGDISSTKEALRVLVKIRDLGKRVLGKDDDLYSSIRKNVKIITNNLAKLQKEELVEQEREERRLEQQSETASAQHQSSQDNEQSTETGAQLLNYETQASAPISVRLKQLDSFDLGDEVLDKGPPRDTDLRPRATDQSQHEQSLSRPERGIIQAPPAASAEPAPPVSDRKHPPHKLSDATLLNGNEDDLAGADDWFDIWLRKSHDLLEMLRPLRSGPGNRPRIAILDTGLNTAHPEVAELHSRRGPRKRIQDGRSWISSGSTAITDGGDESHDSNQGGTLPWYEDEDGHGTHCAMVAHQVAPDADLYICRIFKDRNSVSGSYVAEAIEHAVQEWHVDIISMSFALAQWDHENKKVVSKKIYDKVGDAIFFAAASNAGKHSGITFPASHREVFSIRAADFHGRDELVSFNPLYSLEDVNLSVLGLHVLAPHRDHETSRRSGTSVATAVAAGIAALVFEFVRQSEQTPMPEQPSIRHLDKLKTKKGMIGVFRLMRDLLQDVGMCQNLQPWYLFEGGAHGDEDGKVARRTASMLIDKALSQ
ncbi:uncharacterized protein HMPREF1541_05385 [Cyphellophora europaea CBS 101466]|uniref:Peptidase S8/S53 domain-containing protein n=1 Tax=Cyphellophora europaea (strain CBS 101466) TaxID=1220924 RepID=W2RRS0_CYPE1|nr:uncharacterized protein HMPREF1541_05385 [Cyphellophora europaea CBS 101466]ETN39162.1 hypothetical protein HMPREF1541_05385 [Cyphellophora europaea CBS 101466]